MAVQEKAAAAASVAEAFRREEWGEGLFLLCHLSAALPRNAASKPFGSALQEGEDSNGREDAGGASGGGSGGDPPEGGSDDICMWAVARAVKLCQQHLPAEGTAAIEDVGRQQQAVISG